MTSMTSRISNERLIIFDGLFQTPAWPVRQPIIAPRGQNLPANALAIDGNFKVA